MVYVLFEYALTLNFVICIYYALGERGNCRAWLEGGTGRIGAHERSVEKRVILPLLYLFKVFD